MLGARPAADVFDVFKVVLGWLASAFLVLGCAGSPVGPGDGGPARVDPSWVVGSARTSLGADGLFNFAATFSAEVGTLSRDQALELARAAIRHTSVSIGGGRQTIENEHGRPIEWDELDLCPRRIIPQFSNFKDPGANAVPYYVRTPIGPSYRYEFCSRDNRRSVRVQVFVRTLARVATDGAIQFPSPNGTEYLVSGIPLLPLTDLSPEFGARLVFERVAIPIAEEPELDGCLLVIPNCAGALGLHWRFVLDSEVTVRRPSGETARTKVVYTQAGFGDLETDRVYVAVAPQPEPGWLQFWS